MKNQKKKLNSIYIHKMGYNFQFKKNDEMDFYPPLQTGKLVV